MSRQFLEVALWHGPVFVNTEINQFGQAMATVRENRAQKPLSTHGMSSEDCRTLAAALNLTADHLDRHKRNPDYNVIPLTGAPGRDPDRG